MLSAGFGDGVAARERLFTLSAAVVGRPDFEALAVAFERAGNTYPTVHRARGNPRARRQGACPVYGRRVSHQSHARPLPPAGQNMRAGARSIGAEDCARASCLFEVMEINRRSTDGAPDLVNLGCARRGGPERVCRGAEGAGARSIGAFFLLLIARRNRLSFQAL